MKPRERVLKAFRKMDGNPDRIPVQFEMCRQLLDHFGEKLGIPVKYTDNLYEDVTYRISGNEVRTAMGCDVVVTGAGPADDFGSQTDLLYAGRWKSVLIVLSMQISWKNEILMFF